MLRTASLARASSAPRWRNEACHPHHSPPSMFRKLTILALFLTASLAFGGAADERFLKAQGNEIRDAKGRKVLLRGVNLGGWLVIEPWMSPVDSSGTIKCDYSVRETLAKRFGAETAESLLQTYQENWITARRPRQDRRARHERDPCPVLVPQRPDRGWHVDSRWSEAPRLGGQRSLETRHLFHHRLPRRARRPEQGRQHRPQAGEGRILAQRSPHPAHRSHLAQGGGTLQRQPRRRRLRPDQRTGRSSVARRAVVHLRPALPGNPQGGSRSHHHCRRLRHRSHRRQIHPLGLGGLPHPDLFGWKNVLYQMHHYEWDWKSGEKQLGSIDFQVSEWNKHKNSACPPSWASSTRWAWSPPGTMP